MKVYVYQSADLGWDNVIGVFSNENAILHFLNEEQGWQEDHFDTLEEALEYYDGWVTEHTVDKYL